MMRKGKAEFEMRSKEIQNGKDRERQGKDVILVKRREAPDGARVVETRKTTLKMEQRFRLR